MAKRLEVVPDIPVEAVVSLVNEYGAQARPAAEGRDAPDPASDLGLPAGSRQLPTRELAFVAENLWAVITPADPSERATRLTQVLHDCDLHPVVDDRGRLGWLTSLGSARLRLLAGCAVALLDFVRTHGWARLGICSAVDCVNAYLSTDGRGGRRYCSHTCLNRSRLRAYRARQRQ